MFYYCDRSWQNIYRYIHCTILHVKAIELQKYFYLASIWYILISIEIAR